ncbi:MAG TPA: carboxypeptidase-like regulatory domain-containing protein [Thermoanaerobaculia bacterium]
MRILRLDKALALTIWLALPMKPAIAQEAIELAPVEITVYLASPADLPIQGEVVLGAIGKESQPVQRVPLSSLKPLSVKLPPGSSWEVSAEVPGFWVRRQELRVGSPDQVSRVSLSLWPLGTISGTVKVKEKGLALPRKLLVETLAAPAFLKRPAVPPGALGCPVDKEGAWSCSLPAATFDLVISAEGFTPHYRWGIELQAGKRVNLGTVVLERGASVAGWVAVEGGVIDTDRCVARLSPLLAEGTDLRKSVDLERTAREEPVRKDGFFQLKGLSPGLYALEVRQPGYAPAKLSPVQVDPRSETFLRDPLILARPLDLAFTVTPPLDWLGKPWHAQVFRVRDEGTRLHPIVFESSADSEGRFTVPGQSPGRYRILILDSLGNRLYSDDNRQVDGPASEPLLIEIELVDLEGSLRLGREPLRGTLWFGGRSGEVSVKMETDREGRFFGLLPREGFWIVDVEAEEPIVRVRAQTDVQAGRSGKASLEIDLPDTRVFGRVVDEQGKPAAQALVIVEGKSPVQSVRADASGAFAIRGLQEGPVKLGATLSSQASDLVQASLVEGRAVGPIELRLRRVERLAGRVLSARGPVAGSRVLVSSFPSGGGGAVGTTGTDGAFSVDIPPDIHQVVAFVSAPGFAFQAFGPMEKTALNLLVSEEGGSLEVTLPGSGEDLLRQDKVLVLFQNGLPVPVGLLSQWSYDQGVPREATGRRTFRNVALGEYRACIVPRQLEPSLMSGVLSVPEAVCAAGMLSPGATLSLAPGTPAR